MTETNHPSIHQYWPCPTNKQQGCDENRLSQAQEDLLFTASHCDGLCERSRCFRQVVFGSVPLKAYSHSTVWPSPLVDRSFCGSQSGRRPLLNADSHSTSYAALRGQCAIDLQTPPCSRQMRRRCCCQTKIVLLIVVLSPPTLSPNNVIDESCRVDYGAFTCSLMCTSSFRKTARLQQDRCASYQCMLEDAT